MKSGTFFLLLAVSCGSTSEDNFFSEDEIIRDWALAFSQENELSGGEDIFLHIPHNTKKVIRAAENAAMKFLLPQQGANPNQEPRSVYRSWLDALADSKLTEEQLEDSFSEQLVNLSGSKAVNPVTLGGFLVALAGKDFDHTHQVIV